MEKKFHFVNGISPDEASKRLVRRHVMKGKNAGKKVHRRSRMDLQVTQSRPNIVNNPLRLSEDMMQKYYRTNWRYVSPSRLSIDFGNAFLPFSLTFSPPVEVTPDSLDIINEFFIYTSDRIYPVKLGVSLHDAKSAWLGVLFESEATFHCSLALMQAGNEIFHCDGESSAKALYHLSQTFAQVKKRLEGDDALSDSTIAIVMSLINQEQMRQQYSAAVVHVKGLQRMIELRGGLSQLEGNLPLVLKICKTDIIFAFQNGGPTAFFRDRMNHVRNSLWAQGLPLDRNLDVLSTRSNHLDPYLRDILFDIMSISSLFSNLDDKTVNYMTFLEILTSLCYRLLRFRSLGDASTRCDVQAGYHIGLTIFMMTLFLQNDRRRMIKYCLIPVCLRNVLQSEVAEQEDEDALWLMIIGGIWISGEPESDWLAPRIRSMAQRLGLDSWDKARDCLCKYPWIGSQHDQPGRELWNRVHYLH